MGIKGPETSEGNWFHLPYIITCGFTAKATDGREAAATFCFLASARCFCEKDAKR